MRWKKNGEYPFFTCGGKPFWIDTYAFDMDAILVSERQSGYINKYTGKFNAYQRTYVLGKLIENLNVSFLYSIIRCVLRKEYITIQIQRQFLTLLYWC